MKVVILVILICLGVSGCVNTLGQNSDLDLTWQEHNLTRLLKSYDGSKGKAKFLVLIRNANVKPYAETESYIYLTPQSYQVNFTYGVHADNMWDGFKPISQTSLFSFLEKGYTYILSPRIDLSRKKMDWQLLRKKSGAFEIAPNDYCNRGSEKITTKYLDKPRAFIKISPNWETLQPEQSDEGFVDLSFTVNSNGAAVDIVVVNSSLAKNLQNKAIKALSKWKFMPVCINGKADDTRIIERFNRKHYIE
ncbi:TonB family protein [Parashewanella curva]|uniref:TonB family protein n=1 Tax=Parashewanella curva TaxID=2338552 RepID=A0A3L8PXS4_9GAMM|nr:TonB family protein [Parashewanella curva]RLV60257.1 TonB family protein [Parashewanella curva]